MPVSGRSWPPAPAVVAGARYPRAAELVDVPTHEVPWVAPPVGSDHATELLRQALVADVQRAALDAGRAAGELTVASARLAMLAAQRVRRRKPPWLR